MGGSAVTRPASRTLHRLLLAATAAVLPLALAACGSSGTSQADKTGAVSGRLVMHFGPGAAPDMPLSGILGFTNSAGVTTKVDVPSSGQFQTRLPVGSYKVDELTPEGNFVICPSSPMPVVVKQGITVTRDVMCQQGQMPNAG